MSTSLQLMYNFSAALCDFLAALYNFFAALCDFSKLYITLCSYYVTRQPLYADPYLISLM